MRSPDEIGALLLFPVLRIVAEQAGLSQPAPFVVYLLRKCPKKANFTKIFASFHFFACFRNPKIFIAKLPENRELHENFRILSLFRVFSQSQTCFRNPKHIFVVAISQRALSSVCSPCLLAIFSPSREGVGGRLLSHFRQCKVTNKKKAAEVIFRRCAVCESFFESFAVLPLF